MAAALMAEENAAEALKMWFRGGEALKCLSITSSDEEPKRRLRLCLFCWNKNPGTKGLQHIGQGKEEILRETIHGH